MLSESSWCSSVVPQRRNGIFGFFFSKQLTVNEKDQCRKEIVGIQTEIQSCSSKIRQNGDTRAQKMYKHKKPIRTKFVSDSRKNRNSTNFFGSTGENDSNYNFLKKALSKMQVVNDSAERAILLAKTYHNKLTTNPNERSHLYQVVLMLQKKISDKLKSTLLKTNLVDGITLRNPLWMKHVVTLKYTTIRKFINFSLFAYSAYTWRTSPLKWLMVYRKISSNALKNYFWNINFSETCYVKSFKYCNVVIIVSFLI